MFVAGEAPQKEELDKVFKAINNEVAYAQVDKVLHDTVIKNVAKTVKLMCAKCEHLIDCSASQVVGKRSFWGSTGSNITPVVQFHEIFVIKIMNE